MANAKIIEQKAALVNDVKDKIQKAQSVVVFDYRGLTVEEVSGLRNEMRKAGVEYIVIKNSIVERACKELNVDESMNSILKGTSAFAFGYSDPVAPAKILKDAIKRLKKGEFKGGIINGTVANVDGINTLADLPSREQLIARLLGSMMSPISGLAIVLGQISKRGSEGTEATAAE